MTGSQIRVVLVDDQALVRAGFALVIDSQDDLTVVGQAADGLEAIDIVASTQPDVVLMDVRMPRLDGIQATERLLKLADEGTIRTPRIIVLTTFDEDDYALAALRGGASGFLLKDALPEVLLDSIRTVVKGGAVIAPTTTRRLLDINFGQHSSVTGTPHTDSSASPSADSGTDPTSDSPGRNVTRVASELDPDRARRLASLTPREREVLGLIGRGMSNSEIVSTLHLAEPTVKTHVGRILMKLGARDRVQAVVFAYDAGIVTPGI